MRLSWRMAFFAHRETAPRLDSMRYSQDVLDFFRATGPGWQTKMDEALKQWIREHPEAANER